jgi:hypothetical protein
MRKGCVMVLANRQFKSVHEQDKDDQRKPDSAEPYVVRIMYIMLNDADCSLTS